MTAPPDPDRPAESKGARQGSDRGQLQGLIDRQAILNQIASSARSVDRLAHIPGHAVFHPDAPAGYVSLYHGTGHGCIDGCIAAHHNLLNHPHPFSNIASAIAVDTARGETYAVITVHRRRSDGRERRDDSVRCIAHRDHVHDMDYGGPGKKADSHPMTDRRDRLDTGYFPAGSAPA